MNAIEPNWVCLLWFAAFATIAKETSGASLPSSALEDEWRKRGTRMNAATSVMTSG